MSKAHTMSDSDSESDIAVPLSQRLFTALHCKKPQSDQIVTKEKQGNANAHDVLFEEPMNEPHTKNIHLTQQRHKSEQIDRTKEKKGLDQRNWQTLERKKHEVEEKRRVKEYENAKKKTMRAAQKTARPGEAIKHVTVMLDPAILKSSAGAVILDILQKHDVNYEIQPQALPDIISFWREVTEVIEKEPFRLETKTKEIVENDILLIMPTEKFISLVHSFKQNQVGIGTGDVTLREYIASVQECLEGRNVTVIVQDMAKYFKEQQTRGKVRKKKLAPSADVAVSRIDVEEALIDAQLQTNSNIRFMASDAEVGKTVLQYTKAIADAPFKRERLKNGLSLFIDGTGTVKISRDGHGVQQAWRQQLLQFRNVKAEVANAIMSQYKSPLQLWKAYQKCGSEQEAEVLLQDIVIRRGVGVMATSRRIGKELSRRLYQLFTSSDPDLVLK